MKQIPLKAVIFDNDGVVLDSELLIFESAARAFAEYDIVLKKEDVQEGIGAGPRYMDLPRKKYGLEHVNLEALLEKRQKYFWQLAPGRLRAQEGFLNCMGFLKKEGLKTALASSASLEIVLRSLSLAKINSALFDVIVDSIKIKHKKPAPDIFLQAAEDLRLPPAACLVLEDALTGIEAARAAGMRVVALLGSFPREALTCADAVIDSLEELSLESLSL